MQQLYYECLQKFCNTRTNFGGGGGSLPFRLSRRADAGARARVATEGGRARVVPYGTPSLFHLRPSKLVLQKVLLSLIKTWNFLTVQCNPRAIVLILLIINYIELKFPGQILCHHPLVLKVLKHHRDGGRRRPPVRVLLHGLLARVVAGVG